MRRCALALCGCLLATSLPAAEVEILGRPREAKRKTEAPSVDVQVFAPTASLKRRNESVVDQAALAAAEARLVATASGAKVEIGKVANQTSAETPARALPVTPVDSAKPKIAFVADKALATAPARVLPVTATDSAKPKVEPPLKSAVAAKVEPAAKSSLATKTEPPAKLALATKIEPPAKSAVAMKEETPAKSAVTAKVERPSKAAVTAKVEPAKSAVSPKAEAPAKPTLAAKIESPAKAALAAAPVRALPDPPAPAPDKKFTFQDRAGNVVAAPIVDAFQKNRIVYPMAKVDPRISPMLTRAASIAQERAHAHSKSRCWRYVKTALLASGIITSYPKTAYAKEAGDELVRDYGFKRLPIRDPYKAPIGAVLVYGSRRAAGHVEIRTKTGFVSDFQNKKPSRRPLLGIYAKA